MHPQSENRSLQNRVGASASEKWGKSIRRGFQIVPNILFRAQHELGLDSVDVVILLNLNVHWWARDTLPYPRPAVIARRMGVSRRTVERRVQKLERCGFLQRVSLNNGIHGPKVRGYRLNGLVQHLERAAHSWPAAQPSA